MKETTLQNESANLLLPVMKIFNYCTFSQTEL